MAIRFNIRMAGVGGQGVVTGSHIFSTGGDQCRRREHDRAFLWFRKANGASGKLREGL